MSTHDGAPPAGSRRAPVRDREDAVVARLRELAADLDDAPDPAFRAATRDRLVAMAAVRSPAPVPRTGLRRLLAHRADDAPSRAWRTRVTAGLAGAAVTVTALGTLVALSVDARPGDLLYGVKRGTEQTRLALAGDGRGLTLLEFAATRLDELAALDGTGDDDAVGLLGAMDAQTTEGAALLATRAVAERDPAPVDDLAGWVAGQSAGLAGLRVPAGAASAAGESRDLLAAVTDRAAGLRTALGCPGGPATDGTDALGPVPVPCPGTGAAPPAAGAPGGEQPGAGGPGPGDEVPESGTAPVPTTAPAPTAGAPSGGGSAGSTGGPPSAAPQEPTGSRAPAPPSLPLPLPPVVGAPDGPVPSSPRTAPPPLLDTPLPVCIPLVLC